MRSDRVFRASHRQPARNPYGQTRAEEPLCVAMIGRELDDRTLATLHETEARALGLDLNVDRLDPHAMVRARPSLAEMLDMLEMAGFAGACIAAPYKRAAVAHVDTLSPLAQAAGAVTTIVFNGRHRHGYNTTAWAFREALRRQLGDRPPGRVLLLGAGPSGAAIGLALKDLGASDILVADPRSGRAEVVALDLGGTVAGNLAEIAPEVDGIVNATPLGSRRRPGWPIGPALLRPHHWIAETRYDPLETDLMRAARARGCTTFDAKTMAVFGLVRDFHLITGHAPDAVRLSASVERHLARQPA